MGVNHRPANIAVPEQLLDGPDIVSIFQQSRRERNDATNDMSQALLSPLCEQLLERLVVRRVPNHGSRKQPGGEIGATAVLPLSTSGFQRIAAFYPAGISFGHDEDVAIASVLQEYGAVGDVVGLAIAVEDHSAALPLAPTMRPQRDRITNGATNALTVRLYTAEYARLTIDRHFE